MDEEGPDGDPLCGDDGADEEPPKQERIGIELGLRWRVPSRAIITSRDDEWRSVCEDIISLRISTGVATDECGFGGNERPKSKTIFYNHLLGKELKNYKITFIINY